MLDQLEMGQTVTVAVPTEAQAWEVMHLEAGYLVRAPAFVPQGQDRAAVMRGCLAANGAPALGEAQARLVFRDPEVVLEALLPTGSGERELQGLLPLLQACARRRRARSTKRPMRLNSKPRTTGWRATLQFRW